MTVLPSFPRVLQLALLALTLFSLEPPAGRAASPQSLPARASQADHQLARLYGAGPASMLWTDSSQVQEALAALSGAAAHGLAPADYGVDALERMTAGGADGWDRALSHAMLRFLADLHFGRVEPDMQLSQPGERARQFDPVAHLRWALQQPRLAAAIDAAAPRLPLYGRVKASLRQYRALAALAQPWQAPAPLPQGGKLLAGRNYPGLGMLRQRLHLLGDLDEAGMDQDWDRHGADLERAIKRFQARHGLAETGHLGRDTLAALAVPLAQRVRQLELTLERLRWMPALPPGRIIVVNVAAYRLWAFDTADRGASEPLEMRVIVGQAARTPTPLFLGQMRYLEFNPYWNVPPSIAKGEILPKLARDAGYLQKNGMELVSPSGLVQHGADAAAMAALRAGKLRIRQTPGAHNVLGAVKFAMPNPMNIYLHSTSARELFGKSRRDLSHGCIRVERPAELAAFVLADQPQWTAQAIAAAMAPGPLRTVRLGEAIPVILFYATAATDRSGRTLFAADIYGRDRPLDAALARR